MNLGKNLTIAAALSCALSSPDKALGLEQLTQDIYSPIQGQEDQMAGLISKVKRGSAFDQKFEISPEKVIPGRQYLAMGFNAELKSNVIFVYSEFGSDATLRTIVQNSPLTQKFSNKAAEGMSYLSFLETNSKGMDGKADNATLYLVQRGYSMRLGNDIIIPIRQIKTLPSDYFEEAYRRALTTPIGEMKKA